MRVLRPYIFLGGLLSFTVFSGFLLSSSVVSADDSVVDQVNITVPVSCSLSGTGMNSHNTTMNNGAVKTSVGETTMKIFCNDTDGFAVYAIGYTDDTDGKNVLTSTDLDPIYDIETGTGSSGDSQWSMKLSTVTNPTPTYPITIQNNFNNYHTVPEEYTVVAQRNSSTDIGENAEGSTLKSTYRIYVGRTQPAGTYVGKVKYVLVHPATALPPVGEDQVGVNYDGNGLFFDQAGTKSTNKVIYKYNCAYEDLYVSNTYQEVMTSNILTGGTQNGPYPLDEALWEPVTISGADKLKVEITYGVSEVEPLLIEGAWDGMSMPAHYEVVADFFSNGTKTYIIDGDTVNILFNAPGYAPDSGYDYGLYAKIYPAYETEQANTTYEPIGSCSMTAVSGGYSEPVYWSGTWKMSFGGETQWFYSENDVINFLNANISEFLGSTITIYASNS